ncbi:MAG: RNA methyltransferase [Candidatus Delongbacteria bacterium]
MCRIWSPGNIGSVLRAMKNFGFTDIVSVNQMNFSEEETLTMCAGAKDHYKYLRFSDDLKKEIADLSCVYGFTARKRRHFRTVSPKEMSIEIAKLPDDAKIGVMFGNETNGLNNYEADICDKTVFIPTSPEYSSLNVAGAAMVAMYELALVEQKKSGMKDNLIDLNEKDDLLKLIGDVVCSKLMERSDNKKQIRENIRHIFRRLKMNKKESGFIRSIFEIVDRKI